MSSSILRSGRFSFREPLLLFPRVRLRENELHLIGWGLRGRYQRSIPLVQVLRVDATRGGRLLLWLDNGETVRLWVDDASGWKKAIDACLLRRAS